VQVNPSDAKTDVIFSLVYVRVVRQWSASLLHSNPIPLHTSLQFSPTAPYPMLIPFSHSLKLGLPVGLSVVVVGLTLWGEAVGLSV